MHQLAINLRVLQLFAHVAHHRVSGRPFLSDHLMLGEFYSAYSDAYDSVIERMIGNGIACDEFALTMKASEALQTLKEQATPEAMLSSLLSGEMALQAEVENGISRGLSQGTINLLAALADDSEVRCYKLRQRLELSTTKEA